MHPRLAGLVDHLARTRAELLAAAEAVPAADRERRPSPNRWTVAEVLDHLRMTEVGSATLLARRIGRAREAGVGPDLEVGSVLGRLDHADVSQGGGLRVAPEVVQPTAGTRFDDALAGLAASRAGLLDVVRLLEDVDATRVMARHAALGEIDAYQWLLFIGQHERRHLRQIEGIRAALAASAPAD